MRPMPKQCATALTVEQTRCPRSPLIITCPGLRRRNSQSSCSRDLEQLHRTQPRLQKLEQKLHIVSAGDDPAIHVLAFRFARGPADSSESPEGGLEPSKSRGDMVRAGLVDLRLHSPLALSRPAFPVEEPRRPRKFVPIHSRV